MLLFIVFFLFYFMGDHLDLHVLTHSFPPRRSSVLRILHGVQPADVRRQLGVPVAEVLKPGIGCGDARQHVAQPTGAEGEGCGHDVLPCLRTALARRTSLVLCHSRCGARRRRRFLSPEPCALLWHPPSQWLGAWGGGCDWGGGRQGSPGR